MCGHAPAVTTVVMSYLPVTSAEMTRPIVSRRCTANGLLAAWMPPVLIMAGLYTRCSSLLLLELIIISCCFEILVVHATHEYAVSYYSYRCDSVLIDHAGLLTGKSDLLGLGRGLNYVLLLGQSRQSIGTT
jgi:hypothetical protein